MTVALKRRTRATAAGTLFAGLIGAGYALVRSLPNMEIPETGALGWVIVAVITIAVAAIVASLLAVTIAVARWVSRGD